MEQQPLVFNLAWAAAVIGFFLPLLISFLKRVEWSQRAKKMLAFGVSAVAGVVNTGVQAGWTFGTPGEFLMLAVWSVIDVYVVASVIYKSFWEDTAVENALAEKGSELPEAA